MDTQRCWGIIEAARADAGAGQVGPGEHALDDALADALIARLVRLGAEDIVAFETRFEWLRERLHRDDVYLAAFLMTHGCGDDGFSDFRAGIVGLGRHWYELVLRDPDNLAGHPAVRGVVAGDVDPHVLRLERFQYAAASAYGQVTGDEDAFYDHCDRVAAATGEDPATPPVRRRLERLGAMFAEAQRSLDLMTPGSG